MKKKFHVIAVILCAFTLFSNILCVSAGTVNIKFNGASKVTVGSTIDLTVKASDIKGFTKGLATVQGDISFNNSYLEYVRYKNASSSLSTSYGTTTKRFVSLGMGGEYISSSGNLIILTFRAKKIGYTNVSLKNLIVGDTKAINHSANTSTKKIQIVGANQGNKNNNPTNHSSNHSGSSSSSSGGTNPTKPSTSNKAVKPTDNSSKSSNNDLEKLIVNNSEISPTFSKDITSYEISIPSSISKLTLDYKTVDSKAKVNVIGNDNLKIGNNVVKIVVTAEDGSTKTYTLNVSKTEETSSNKLASLDIKESNLYPKFNADVNEYSIKLDKGVKKLTIDAVAADNNSKVEIIDNDDLDSDNSVVLVKVTDKNGFSNYYKLKIDNSKNGQFMVFGINILYILLILLVIILLILLLLLFLKRRKKEEEPYKNEDDLYDDIVTKDELIDAISEKNPKKLKMLLTQEEANKLKDAVRIAEEEDGGITKEELIRAVETNDKQRIKKIINKEQSRKARFKGSYPKTEDDVIKEEILKAIDKNDTHTLKVIVKQEEANRLKNELRNNKR